jgi:hypothetical protein
MHFRMDTILTIATVLGGISALIYFADKIISSRRKSIFAEISVKAKEWVSSNYSSYVIEDMSNKQISFIRHPPSKIYIINDNNTLFFMFRAALHYGGNWFFWFSKCKDFQFTIELILNALSQSYDRVAFRSLYVLQFVKHDHLEKALINFSPISAEMRSHIDSYVISKSVKNYLESVVSSKDHYLAAKATEVLREISRYGDDLRGDTG